MPEQLQVRRADAGDVPEITRIYNAGIEARTATFETEPRSEEQIAEQLRTAAPEHVTVVAALNGSIAGWAGLTPYSDRSCYRGIASFSVYVDAACSGRGVGAALVRALIDEAQQAALWKITSRILVGNEASRALCRRLGFREVGVHERHAQLDGEWHDVVIVEVSLPA